MRSEENITQDILRKNGFEYSEDEDRFQKKPTYTIDNKENEYFIEVIFYGIEKCMTLKIWNCKSTRCYFIEKVKEIGITEINDALQLCGIEKRINNLE